MAEETLKYNIEINQEDLAAQLEQVRNQIDLSLGATAFAQDAPPSASSIVQVPHSGVFAAPDVAQQGMMDNMMAQLDQASQFTQVGFTKFQEDARRIGLLANSSMPSYQQNVDIYGQGPTGFFQSTVGTFLPSVAGFDYDLSGMTRPEFRDLAMKNLSSSLDPMKNDLMFTGLGATLGVFGGALGPAGMMAGAITGVAVGGGLDVANQFLGARVRERESLEQGFKQIALQNFGPISSRDAQSMAEGLQDRAYSFEGRALDYDIDDMQNNLVGFANSGGFRNVTSAQEMEDVMEGVIENARQFANNFRMKQQEAVQVMAQLSQNMIVDPSDMGDFSARIDAFSSYTGINPTDAVGLGMQGMQMTRGMGLAAETSFNMTLESRMQAERLRRADPVTRQLINDLGGPDNFALSQLESGVRYMSSGAGLLSAGAMLGNSNFGSTSDVLTSAGAFFSSDPLNMFRIQSNVSDVIGALGVEGMQGMQVTNAYNLANTLGMTNDQGQIDQTAMAGMLSQLTGVSPQQAEATIIAARDASQQDPVQRVYNNFVAEQQSAIRERDYGVTGAVKGFLGENVANPFWEFVEPVGEGLDAIGGFFQRGLEDYSDYMNDRTRIRAVDINDIERSILQGNISESAQAEVTRIRENTERVRDVPTQQEWSSQIPENIRVLMERDPINDPETGGLNLSGRGFDLSSSYKMLRGMSEGQISDFYSDYMGPDKNYTMDDFRFMRASAATRGFDSDSDFTSALQGAFTTQETRSMSPTEFMNAAAQRVGETNFEDLSGAQKKSITDYYTDYTDFEMGGEQTRIGRTLLKAMDRVSADQTGLNSDALLEEADLMEKELISDLMGGSTFVQNALGSGVVENPGLTMNRETATKTAQALATLSSRPEAEKNIAAIAREYDIAPAQLRAAYERDDGKFAKRALSLFATRAVGKESIMKSQAEEIAASYGGTSEQTQRLTETFLTGIESLNLEGGTEMFAENLSMAGSLDGRELTQAESSAMIRDRVFSELDNIVDTGQSSYSQLPPELQQLFKTANRDMDFQAFQKIDQAIGDDGVMKVAIMRDDS